MPEPIQCPHCGQPISYQAPPGQLINCRKCRNVFPVPRGEAGAERAPRVERAAPAQAPRVERTAPAQAPRGGASTPPPQAPPRPAAYVPPGGYGSRRLSNAPANIALIFAVLFFALIAVQVALSSLGVPNMADVTFVMGFIALFCPPIALILGIVGLFKSRDRRRGKAKAITAVSLAGVGLLLLLVVVPSALGRAKEGANRVKCAANLKQIGLAIQLYANENRGQYPPSPRELLLTQDITSEVFICPSSSDTRAPGALPEQYAANLDAGGHDSYIYLGKGKGATTRPDVILVYEATTHHKDGFNVLFADGRVTFIPEAIAQTVQGELQAGQNPPPSLRR